MSTENNDLVLTRVFKAPRSLVFKAWIESERLAQWWGPDGFTAPRCELDARPGGLIRVDMRAPDGTIYPMPGQFREIVEPERLVFTSGALGPDGKLLFEILNTVTFADAGDSTILTLRTHVLSVTPDAGKYLAGQSMGWSQSLERFGAFVKPGPADPSIAATADRDLVISRLFYAPRELLWEAMTDPRHVVNWWGPHGFTTTIEEMDVRPGGVWNHVMRGPDGAEYPNRSVFTEVVKPSRISFSNGGEKKGAPSVSFNSTWTFDALDDNRTRATIHMVFPSPEALERVVSEFGAMEGGRQTLERLAGETDKAPLVLERSFDAPVETVWKAISDKEQMKHWYFEIDDFAAIAGAEFQFAVEHEGHNYMHLCRVVEVQPGKKLAYTWRYDGEPGDSLVTFELFPEGEGTRLRLTHEGLHTFPRTPDYARRNFLSGWTFIVNTGLAKFLGGAG